MGYVVFAFFIMNSEYLFYNSNNDFTHILIMILFLVQLIISYPNNLRFDGTAVFKSFSSKSCMLLSFINIIGIFVVYNNLLINNMGMLYHCFFVLTSIFYYFLVGLNKILLFDRNRDSPYKGYYM